VTKVTFETKPASSVTPDINIGNASASTLRNKETGMTSRRLVRAGFISGFSHFRVAGPSLSREIMFRCQPTRAR
jgi:hypothetical protein